MYTHVFNSGAELHSLFQNDEGSLAVPNLHKGFCRNPEKDPPDLKSCYLYFSQLSLLLNQIRI